MAQRFWGTGLLKPFKKQVPRGKETPERFVELARRCMKNVERKILRIPSSSLQLNHGQCQYLANKLRKLREALSEAETSLARPSSSRIDVKGVEVMKLLWQCAREVEGFIEASLTNNWVQAAIASANMTEYVCQLSAEMEFCMLLIRTYLNIFQPALHEYENSTISAAAVKEIASLDQKALLTILKKVSTSSNSSDEESQLAHCLASRLSQRLSGSVALDCWKIQFSSLDPGPRLGSGSAGVTVRKSKWMGEEVAEKVFQGADHASFRNEVEILAGLAHPNIVPLIGFAEDRNRCTIVMELMNGDLSSLMEDRMRRNRTLKVPFSDSEAMDMMFQTAEGMRYLHEKRVVHRDLKALNILVKRRMDIVGEEVVYAPKVADFGLSKTKESSSSYSSLTTNIGTTRWMAPELLRRGEDDIGARTSGQDSKLRHPFKVDVYSFGMVCYEILTGHVPFSSVSSLVEVRRMILNGGRPEIPERCHELLKQLIRSCWDTDPVLRPCFEEICRSLWLAKRLMMLALLPSTITSAEENRSSGRSPSVEFSLEELVQATNDFNISYKIGQGGCSTVYHGLIRNQKLAIKKMSLENMNWFLAELHVLTNVHHTSLVQLVGYCVTIDNLILVYEYMENGTLAHHLHRSHSIGAPALSWTKRVQISIDAALGLEYIHEHSKPTHIHRDITSASILLDSNFRAKVGNFGLAMMIEDEFHGIVGTFGYMSPEYELYDEVSPKLDVYAFGVVLFEIISGREAILSATDHSSPDGGRKSLTITALFEPILNDPDGKMRLAYYIDPDLENDYPLDAVWKMAQLAWQCTHESPDLRPTMGLAVMELMTLL